MPFVNFPNLKTVSRIAISPTQPHALDTTMSLRFVRHIPSASVDICGLRAPTAQSPASSNKNWVL
ncbi:MAG: hypothetical protein O3A66_02550 [Proteobacteria bacterium]|nr:hypothetical protein [Pseudomonadota bacterium]